MIIPRSPSEGGEGLRIAFFHTTLPEPGRKPGGVEIAVHRLANALVDLGKDEVTFVSSSAPPPDARYRYEPFFRSAPIIHRTTIARTILQSLALNLFDFSRFDIVHLHGDDWFFLLRPTSTVRTLYGSALREAQYSTNWKYSAFMYGVYGLEHLSARLCSLPLALGRDTADIYRLDAAKVVPLGVDEAVFHPGPKHPSPRIFYVGTWKGRKRGKFMYEVFTREVLPQIPDAELCMASDYCPSHPRVIREVFPDDARLAERFREAWVFALPSRYEGFGIPYLEALASGTAVVAVSNPGARDVLEDGRYGVIADDSSFSHAIVRLLSDRAARETAAEAGLARAREFSWPAVARMHRALYSEVVRPGGEVRRGAGLPRGSSH